MASPGPAPEQPGAYGPISVRQLSGTAPWQGGGGGTTGGPPAGAAQLGPGSLLLGPGSLLLAPGSLLLGPGSLLLGPGSLLLGLGSPQAPGHRRPRAAPLLLAAVPVFSRATAAAVPDPMAPGPTATAAARGPQPPPPPLNPYGSGDLLLSQEAQRELQDAPVREQLLAEIEALPWPRGTWTGAWAGPGHGPGPSLLSPAGARADDAASTTAGGGGPVGPGAVPSGCGGAADRNERARSGDLGAHGGDAGALVACHTRLAPASPVSPVAAAAVRRSCTAPEAGALAPAGPVPPEGSRWGEQGQQDTPMEVEEAGRSGTQGQQEPSLETPLESAPGLACAGPPGEACQVARDEAARMGQRESGCRPPVPVSPRAASQPGPPAAAAGAATASNASGAAAASGRERRGRAGSSKGGAGGGGADLQALARVFDLKAEDAARALGLTPNELKRRCRAMGIQRWPQRKLMSLRRIAEAAQADGALPAEERQATILVDPDAPLHPALTALRQAQYKQAARRATAALLRLATGRGRPPAAAEPGPGPGPGPGTPAAAVLLPAPSRMRGGDTPAGCCDDSSLAVAATPPPEPRPSGPMHSDAAGPLLHLRGGGVPIQASPPPPPCGPSAAATAAAAAAAVAAAQHVPPDRHAAEGAPGSSGPSPAPQPQDHGTGPPAAKQLTATAASAAAAAAPASGGPGPRPGSPQGRHERNGYGAARRPSSKRPPGTTRRQYGSASTDLVATDAADGSHGHNRSCMSTHGGPEPAQPGPTSLLGLVLGLSAVDSRDGCEPAGAAAGAHEGNGDGSGGGMRHAASASNTLTSSAAAFAAAGTSPASVTTAASAFVAPASPTVLAAMRATGANYQGIAAADFPAAWGPPSAAAGAPAAAATAEEAAGAAPLVLWAAAVDRAGLLEAEPAAPGAGARPRSAGPSALYRSPVRHVAASIKLEPPPGVPFERAASALAAAAHGAVYRVMNRRTYDGTPTPAAAAAGAPAGPPRAHWLGCTAQVAVVRGCVELVCRLQYGGAALTPEEQASALAAFEGELRRVLSAQRPPGGVAEAAAAVEGRAVEGGAEGGDGATADDRPTVPVDVCWVELGPYAQATPALLLSVDPPVISAPPPPELLLPDDPPPLQPQPPPQPPPERAPEALGGAGPSYFLSGPSAIGSGPASSAGPGPGLGLGLGPALGLGYWGGGPRPARVSSGDCAALEAGSEAGAFRSGGSSYGYGGHMPAASSLDFSGASAVEARAAFAAAAAAFAARQDRNLLHSGSGDAPPPCLTAAPAGAIATAVADEPASPLLAAAEAPSGAVPPQPMVPTPSALAALPPGHQAAAALATAPQPATSAPAQLAEVLPPLAALLAAHDETATPFDARAAPPLTTGAADSRASSFGDPIFAAAAPLSGGAQQLRLLLGSGLRISDPAISGQAAGAGGDEPAPTGPGATTGTSNGSGSGGSPTTAAVSVALQVDLVWDDDGDGSDGDGGASGGGGGGGGDGGGGRGSGAEAQAAAGLSAGSGAGDGVRLLVEQHGAVVAEAERVAVGPGGASVRLDVSGLTEGSAALLALPLRRHLAPPPPQQPLPTASSASSASGSCPVGRAVAITASGAAAPAEAPPPPPPPPRPPPLSPLYLPLAVLPEGVARELQGLLRGMERSAAAEWPHAPPSLVRARAFTHHFSALVADMAALLAACERAAGGAEDRALQQATAAAAAGAAGAAVAAAFPAGAHSRVEGAAPPGAAAPPEARLRQVQSLPAEGAHQAGGSDGASGASPSGSDSDQGLPACPLGAGGDRLFAPVTADPAAEVRELAPAVLGFLRSMGLGATLEYLLGAAEALGVALEADETGNAPAEAPSMKAF
ncbi:hypothetical protein HYH03_003790 [Edaphochlamys debaryana]|uniref:RWP-RK domain-containing protein n=1 Tax=Edaphochlamys debaryana TaxID=47281 RepID=A0A835YAA1_9CHLO|nr:hypothetical protein HYH03_003790 [Edaphochlamys debaryana]|eukprot:KAG2498029.1 hypothetical protein HYH03_003790 [Edaphochlamys debaryana]